MKWIKIEEKYPESNRYVLCCFEILMTNSTVQKTYIFAYWQTIHTGEKEWWSKEGLKISSDMIPICWITWEGLDKEVDKFMAIGKDCNCKSINRFQLMEIE